MQVRENFKALEVIPKLTPEVMEEIEKVFFFPPMCNPILLLF